MPARHAVSVRGIADGADFVGMRDKRPRPADYRFQPLVQRNTEDVDVHEPESELFIDAPVQNDRGDEKKNLAAQLCQSEHDIVQYRIGQRLQPKNDVRLCHRS